MAIEGAQELATQLGDATVTPVRPGDTLAVQLGYTPTNAELDHLHERLAEVLPEGVKVVFFDSDVKFGILRPDSAA